jgi:hypothetical protein
MTKKREWLKWSPQAWLSDPIVREMDLAERGFYIDVLMLCAVGTPCGYLSVRNLPLDNRQISRSLGIFPKTSQKFLESFRNKGVLSYDETTKVFYSERMVKDHESYINSSANGLLGAEERLKRLKPPLKTPLKTEEEEEEEQEQEEKNERNFKNFYDLYDKKVGRVKAKKEWDKLNVDDELLQTILKAIPPYKIANPDSTYRKDPERWLKDKRWLDDVSTSTNSVHKIHCVL